MPTLTADQVEDLRDEIGDSTPPDDTELQDIYDRKYLQDETKALTLTALAVLQKRYVTLASGGALSFTVVGEYGENRAANMNALKDQISRIRSTGLGEEGPVTGRVTVGSFGQTWGR